MFIYINQRTISLIALYKSTTLLLSAKQNLFIDMVIPALVKNSSKVRLSGDIQYNLQTFRTCTLSILQLRPNP